MDQFKDIRTKAYVVEKSGAPFILQDVILDEVRDDEVLVEMKYTGLCHTVSLKPCTATDHVQYLTTYGRTSLFNRAACQLEATRPCLAMKESVL